MIAGFEQPDEGRIVLHGAGRAPPSRRTAGPSNMVFQQYALFPHMSVYDNVAFGLKVKRVPRGEHRDRDRSRSCSVVELEGLERRRTAPALRRPAAAGRARAGARQPAGGAPARRAARRARREAPQADAARAEADPARARDDVRLRDARPGGGARDVRPDRGHERRPRRADREPARDLRASARRAFVADFIGSLNALELRVDELVGGYAVMRLGEGERVVVAVGGDATDRRRRSASPCAPSGCRSTGRERRADGGSRLEGTIAEIVYLGMYTQFHVDTPAGRVVSPPPRRRVARRAARSAPASRSPGTPEHASLLDERLRSTVA